MKFYCKTEIPDWEHKAKLANYRVKGFARLVGMSKTTLQRFFREHVGKTAKQWLLETQMVHGFLLLAEGHSAKVTSALVGLKDAATFTRRFHRVHGASPRQVTMLLREAN